MDIGTAIIGILTIAICIVPFAVAGKNKKKKEQ